MGFLHSFFSFQGIPLPPSHIWIDMNPSKKLRKSQRIFQESITSPGKSHIFSIPMPLHQPIDSKSTPSTPSRHYTFLKRIRMSVFLWVYQKISPSIRGIPLVSVQKSAPPSQKKKGDLANIYGYDAFMGAYLWALLLVRNEQLLMTFCPKMKNEQLSIDYCPLMKIFKIFSFAAFLGILQDSSEALV